MYGCNVVISSTCSQCHITRGDLLQSRSTRGDRSWASTHCHVLGPWSSPCELHERERICVGHTCLHLQFRVELILAAYPFLVRRRRRLELLSSYQIQSTTPRRLFCCLLPNCAPWQLLERMGISEEDMEDASMHYAAEGDAQVKTVSWSRDRSWQHYIVVPDWRNKFFFFFVETFGFTPCIARACHTYEMCKDLSTVLNIWLYAFLTQLSRLPP